MAKKVLSIALALLMIFNVFAVAVSAADNGATITLATDKANYAPGETVDVTVSLKTTYPVFALQMMIAYDSACFELVGATGNLSSTGAKFTSVTDSASLVAAAEEENINLGANLGLVRIGYAWLPSDGATDAVAFDNDTAIATLQFKVKDDAAIGKGAIQIAPEFVVKGTAPAFDPRLATYVGKGTTTIADSVVKGQLYGNPIDAGSVELTIEEAACAHNEATREENRVEPTESTPGSYVKVTYCTICGEEFNRETITIPALGHTHTEEVIPEVPATCEKEGSTAGKKCKTCGEILVAPTKIEKLPHKEVVIPAVAATCTKTGLTEGKKCSVCGTVTVAQTATPKAAHTAGAPVEEKGVDATATTPGYKFSVVYCTECNFEMSRTKIDIPALGHTPGAAVREKIVAASCAREGSYDEVVYCTCCTPKVEINRVKKTIEKLPHTEATIHGYAATCTKTGLTDGIECSVCYEIIKAQEVIPTVAHTNSAVVTDPTCTDKGYTTYTCSVCGKVEKADYVDALGHKEEIIPAVPATCTESGLKAGKKCTVCGVTTVEQEVVAALGHKKAAAVEEDRQEPDCENAGSYNSVVYCKVCNAELSRENKEIPALGHTPGEAREENRIEATESADGSYEKVVDCTVCGKEVSRETVILPSYSKANAKVTTVISKDAVKAGDVVTVTVKLTTNFYVSNFQIPVIFDKTQFEVVGTKTNSKYLTFSDMFAERKYQFGGRADQQKGFDATINPDVWNTPEAKAQYGVARMTASYSITIDNENETYAKPQDDVVATFQLKALTDVDNTAESIFVSTDWAKSETNKKGDFLVSMMTTEGYYDEDRKPISYVNVTYETETIAVAGVTVSGTVKSFDDKIASNSDDVTINFYAEGSDEVAYTTTVSGSGVQEYAVDEIVAGTYTVVVSKANHATRTYIVVVGDANVEQELVIHLIGDVTGEGLVNAIDVARANAHAKGTKALVDYELDCADFTGDDKVNALDVARINAHAKGTKSLWS